MDANKNLINYPLTNKGTVCYYHHDSSTNIINWIGQSIPTAQIGGNSPSFAYNKFYADFTLTNNNLKLKNINKLSFQLTYKKTPVYYDDNYSFIILLLGYNDNNNNLKQQLQINDFLLLSTEGYPNDNLSRNNLYYYNPNGQTGTTERYINTGISLGGNYSNNASIIKRPDDTGTIKQINSNIILFKPSTNINLHTSNGNGGYIQYSELETTTFEFDFTNNPQNYKNYCLFITGPIIYSRQIVASADNYYEYQHTPNSPAVLQFQTSMDTIDLTINGQLATIPIQIPAFWSGDIIKAEDSITKDSQRLDSILQALQGDEYGWKVISDYPTNPALITPTQYNTFITVNYARPLQKIYELCLPYEATEYNNETSEYKACYAVRHLGNPTQFSIIPKLDIYYNALKELFPDCFEIETEGQEENG